MSKQFKNSIEKILERDKIDIPNTHLLLSRIWEFGPDTSYIYIAEKCRIHKRQHRAPKTRRNTNNFIQSISQFDEITILMYSKGFFLVLRSLSAIFKCFKAVSYIGGRNPSNRRKNQLKFTHKWHHIEVVSWLTLPGIWCKCEHSLFDIQYLRGT